MSLKMTYSVNDTSIDAKKAKIFTNALVELAKEQVPYSFFISKIIWGASLYLECGHFKENWNTYPRASDAANRIRQAAGKDWRGELTFEHSQPLNQVYLLLQSQGPALTLEKAAEIIAEYPPVLITKEEDKMINANGHKTGGSPEERYLHIPLSGFSLRSK
jgi:hypothetical protein